MRNRYVHMLSLFVLALAALAMVQTTAFAQVNKQNAEHVKVDPPTLSCGHMEYPHRMKLQVTGGGIAGALGGFTVDWMPYADYVANGNSWYGDNDYYRAAFVGTEGGVTGEWNYNLAKNESTFVTIGECLFDDACATTDDFYKLYYRTKYVFRVRAHATAEHPQSPWSETALAQTAQCGGGGECITKTQGWWKTKYPHPWPKEVIDNGMFLGNVHYTAAELEDIFNEPAAGNGLISLAHQLIAAKLNIEKFGLPSDPDAAQRILDTIADADALIGDLVVPPIGSGDLDPSETSELNDELTAYNEKYDC